MRSDFAGIHLPCSDFGTNTVYFRLRELTYNLLALLRMTLPVNKWERCLATFYHYRLYAMAGQIVHYARQRTLKLDISCKPGFDQVLWSICNPLAEMIEMPLAVVAIKPNDPDYCALKASVHPK